MRKPRLLSQEHKDNIGKANKGRKQSPEHIAKRIESNKGKVGIHYRGKRGAGTPCWKGGVTKDIKKYMKEYGKKWTEKNREYKNYLTNKRRCLKLKSEGSHTFGDWELLKKQYNFTCPCCHKKEPEIVLSQDHIIPVSRGGSDNIENIQPLCGSCNSKKHTKDTKYEKL